MLSKDWELLGKGRSGQGWGWVVGWTEGGLGLLFSALTFRLRRRDTQDTVALWGSFLISHESGDCKTTRLVTSGVPHAHEQG
jgi:hypothetical protein